MKWSITRTEDIRRGNGLNDNKQNLRLSDLFIAFNGISKRVVDKYWVIVFHLLPKRLPSNFSCRLQLTILLHKCLLRKKSNTSRSHFYFTEHNCQRMWNVISSSLCGSRKVVHWAQCSGSQGRILENGFETVGLLLGRNYGAAVTRKCGCLNNPNFISYCKVPEKQQ
jgi:hypothetical protein